MLVLGTGNCRPCIHYPIESVQLWKHLSADSCTPFLVLTTVYMCLRWGHSSVETKDRFLSPWLNGDVLFSIVFNQNAGTDKSVFPLPEPQDVFLAAQVKFDDLSRDLRQLGRDLTSTWCLYCNLYLFQLLLSKHSRKHPSRVMNENTVRDIGWLHISSALSRQAVIISIHVDWMSGIVSLWSFCCVFLLENLSQSV